MFQWQNPFAPHPHVRDAEGADVGISVSHCLEITIPKNHQEIGESLGEKTLDLVNPTDCCHCWEAVVKL